MKILPLLSVSTLLLATAAAPLRADVPTALKAPFDPKLESLTTRQLQQLLRDINTDNGFRQLKAAGLSPNRVVEDTVLALAQLGRYDLALQYTSTNDQAGNGRWGGSFSAAHPPLAPAKTRTNIYELAIMRMVVFGQRQQGRALVPRIKAPADRVMPLLWLAAGALHDGRKTEALSDLRSALKVGGSEASQHEWLGLLMARAGQTGEATKIFKARQRFLEKTRVSEAREMENTGWGSLCGSLYLAGRTTEALALLKKHPQGYSGVFYRVYGNKPTTQSQRAIEVMATLPDVLFRTEQWQILALLPKVQGRATAKAKATVATLERGTLQQMAGADRKAPEFASMRTDRLAKVVGAWLYIGEPSRAAALLKRPEVGLNDGGRALVEALAIAKNAGAMARANGNNDYWNQTFKLPPAQSRGLRLQIVNRFRRLMPDDIQNERFAEAAGEALDVLLKVGDRSGAIAVVRASEQAVQRSIRSYGVSDIYLANQFWSLAAINARIGDTTSTKKWMARYKANTPNFNQSHWVGIYQWSGLNEQARTVVNSFPRPVIGPFSAKKPANAVWNEIEWRNYGFREYVAARSLPKTPAIAKTALSFPAWTRTLPLEARAQLLPNYAILLPGRSSSSGLGVRDSGLWEFAKWQ